MARRRRKKTFARITSRFPFFQLGSSPAEHEERAAYHRRSEDSAIARGLAHLREGKCEKALSELLSAKLYDGMRWAHAEAGGMKNAAISPSPRSHSVVELEVAFHRACPIPDRATMHGARRRR